MPPKAPKAPRQAFSDLERVALRRIYRKEPSLT